MKVIDEALSDLGVEYIDLMLIHQPGSDDAGVYKANESDLYKELGTLTKDRERWETSIPYVSSLLSHDSVKIQAKALWLLGEILPKCD